MGLLESYSTSYEVARRRFREAAADRGARLERHSISIDGHVDGELTIDVAILGRPDPQRAVVISSGLHGVEGFVGSAIQLAWLTGDDATGFEPGDGAVVLIHAINPYGFESLRRTNEDNVDLNRNFLSSIESYQGSPAGYGDLDGYLNPPSPPSRWEPYRLAAIWNVRRHGLPAMKNAVAGGQYEYPKGLFFGGNGPAQSTRVVQENFKQWIHPARDAVHVDFHSGLGKYGQYRLLISETEESPHLDWYRDSFGTGFVEPMANAERTAYEASGLMGDWLTEHLADRSYRFLGAEFGTYSVIRVLGALRAENRARLYCEPGSRAYQLAKREILECFCPADESWRTPVLEQGLQIIEQAMRARTT